MNNSKNINNPQSRVMSFVKDGVVVRTHLEIWKREVLYDHCPLGVRPKSILLKMLKMLN